MLHTGVKARGQLGQTLASQLRKSLVKLTGNYSGDVSLYNADAIMQHRNSIPLAAQARNLLRRYQQDVNRRPLTTGRIAITCILVGNVINSDALCLACFHSELELHKLAGLGCVGTFCQGGFEYCEWQLLAVSRNVRVEQQQDGG